MRVIAGTARRLLLKAPPGKNTRSTSDITKETLFNIINERLYQARFLDLFAGSGAIGIEALSRGAREAVFVEKSAEALSCISYNLKHTRLDRYATILKMEVIKAVKILSDNTDTDSAFDIIFLDPPYNKGLEAECLQLLIHSRLVKESTLIIIEADKALNAALFEDCWNIIKIKEYKNNKHIFLSRRQV